MVGVRSFLFFPFSLSPPCPTKNSIAGNRTRGTNVKGLYVTNYTTMDVYYIACVFSSSPFSLKNMDPTNRIRTSDLRNSILDYSPPLYQLSYGRCPFFPLFSLLPFPPCPTKNSIAGNRTRGTNVKGLYVTNYTTMDN